MIVNRNGLSDPTWPVNPVIRGLWPCAIDSNAVCGASSVPLVWSVQKSQILMKRKIFTVIIFPPLTGFSFLKANVGGGGVADCHVTSPVHPFAWSIPTIDGHHRERQSGRRFAVGGVARAGRRRSLLEVWIVSRSAVHISETQAPG